MGFKRHATAHWEGDLKTGQGRMSTPQSGLFDGTRYSFNTRFGEEKGSNPEELLAAAHAGCFSMALSFILGNEGYTRGLLDIRGWQSMTVTQAAQAVQISAYPDHYAKWETSAWVWLYELT